MTSAMFWIASADSSRLADDVRGEVGMSRAIELARAGADREAVSDATGLSLEEAEAIVTFHGKIIPYILDASVHQSVKARLCRHGTVTCGRLCVCKRY